MRRKYISFYVDPKTHKRLKVLSVMLEVTINDTLEFLLDLHGAYQHETSPEIRQRLQRAIASIRSGEITTTPKGPYPERV